MKKRLFSLLLVSALVFTLSGCGEKSLLRESDPVTLNFWHVYGAGLGQSGRLERLVYGGGAL